ncbi:flagellar protein FlgN [Rhodococcus sp. X156]|uniref:flagellar protein FlgN n=1 Tax=Rhodococcus sp. X156 TaxID=2499145 RepID=UPI000FD97AE4|nr:flagellar protein FlgN [Rhodococcus sp. X156]
MVQTKEAAGYSAVSTVLWREREALQHVQFKLVQQQLILQSGQTRMLDSATEELESALDQLRCTEVLRAIESEVIAADLEVDELPTLAELAAEAPEPWATVLTEHRSALRALTDEVDTTTRTNRELLTAGASTVRESLQQLTGSLDTYDHRGGAEATGRAPVLMDQQA